MLIATIFLFVIAACFGVVLLSAILKNKKTPKPVVFIHGCVAGLALLILITYIATGNTSPLLITSATLFVLAALGGLAMFTKDISKQPIPKVIAVLHPIIAISALVILVIYVLQRLH